MNTVFIPAGTFIMGDNEVPSSSPAHSVTLTRGFYMGECEVTNTQYADFLNAGTVSGTISLTQGDETDGIYASANVLGSSQKLVFDCMTGTRSPWGVTYNTVTSQWEATSGKGNYPVGYVTWYGAKAFASWAKGKVPTSAQWEYACRAGTTTPWATATGTSTDLGTYAWWISNSGLSTHPVKTKNPNLWNLYDMIGNAEEWCDDKSRNYTPAAVTDPVGNGTPIILRQSGCYANDDACRSAFYMTVLDPNDVFPQSGFRIAFVP